MSSPRAGGPDPAAAPRALVYKYSKIYKITVKLHKVHDFGRRSAEPARSRRRHIHSRVSPARAQRTTSHADQSKFVRIELKFIKKSVFTGRAPFAPPPLHATPTLQGSTTSLQFDTFDTSQRGRSSAAISAWTELYFPWFLVRYRDDNAPTFAAVYIINTIKEFVPNH